VEKLSEECQSFDTRFLLEVDLVLGRKNQRLQPGVDDNQSIGKVL
jgi:hypothetical protein